MCGVTGWVAFGRNLTDQHEILATMTATLDCRGPDAEGSWVTGHAAFGHRRLAVIDLEGSAQPMTVEEDGQPLVSLTYSGEIYNHRELRALLKSRGHRFRTAGDTEVVARAYLQWGTGFLARLNGMFAFGLWDARTEELLLVRDRLGIKPLLYHPTDDGLLFGSEHKALLAHPAVVPEVGLDGLRELLTLTKNPGSGVYRGIHEVRPGHYLRISRAGLSDHRYWALEAREHTDDLATTVSTVRELLNDTVQHQMIADVPVCTLLSGGLDSSVITALAARTLHRTGHGPVRTFALGYRGQHRHFSPSTYRPTLDLPYARLMARHVNADHTDIMLDAGTLADPKHRTVVMRARDLPSAFGDFDTSLHLLFADVRRHSTVALSGEGADELFGGYQWFHPPHTLVTDSFPWQSTILHPAGPDAAPRHALLDPGLLARLDLPAYLADSYQQALAEVPHLPTADPTERRMREITYLHLTRFLPLMLERKDRLSMANGLEVRVPLCDHRLVQYVFNTPWSMKTFDGREKSLLRAATEDLLPKAVLDRAKSPYPRTSDPRYPLGLRAQLTTMAADRTSPVLPLLDPARLADACATQADPRTVRAGAETALGINAWLHRYPVTLLT